jgi:membrane-associated protein
MQNLIDFAWSVINFILRIDVHLVAITTEYGAWTYVVLFLIVFAETGFVVTPFLPGDSLLFAAGALAALGSLDITIMMATLFVAAVIGDAVNYHIGRYLGPKVLSGKYPFLKKEYLEKTQGFYDKYGVKTIIIARFVPIVRTFAPFMAGVGNMNYGRFFTYNVVGALLWVLICCLAGYFFGNIPVVKKNFGLVVLGIIIVSVLPMAIEILRAKLASKKVQA